MSGYCDDCGNTECICKAIAASGDGVSLDWSALVAERDRLRAENARLTSEVERLEAKFQQNFGCHHSWVRDHAEHRRLLSEVERLRAVQRAAMGLLSWDWMRLLPDTPVGDDVRRDADILEAALTALDAAGGEGKR